jgi:hypothetical protein
MARTRLNIDWDSLFPGDTLKIGDTSVVIRPLGMLALASIAKQLKGFGTIVAEDGVTWDNYGTPENIIKIAAILLDKFPSILAEASNIEEEDLSRLPIDQIVNILNVVLEVNLKSRGDLEKNLQSLAGKFQTAMASQK